MHADAFFFWVFAAILVGSALTVISARNPVHSVLFLILAFVNAAGLFILLGAEFLAMILVVVYVGAVAVLFLFVVMLLDVDFAELKQGYVQYLLPGSLIALCVGAELVYVSAGWSPSPAASAAAAPAGALNNTAALGRVLYTQYFYFFQAGGDDSPDSDDRRDRPDPAPQGRRQAPERRRPGGAQSRDRGRTA